MSGRNKKSTREGFTLVEAVIAIMILALGLGGVALTFNMAMRSVDTNRVQMAVTHFARNQVETLRSLPWSDPALNAGTYGINGPPFTGSYTVTDVSSELKDISVSVSWPDSMTQGTANTVLTTTFAKPLH